MAGGAEGAVALAFLSLYIFRSMAMADILSWWRYGMSREYMDSGWGVGVLICKEKPRRM